MGGFCYVSRNNRSPELMAETLKAARRQFTASGFHSPITHDNTDGVFDFYPKIDYHSSDSILLPDGFAVAIGTFLYGGAIGAEAIRRFTMVKNPSVALHDAEGHFVLIVRRGTQTLLMRDRIGAFEVFLDDTLSVISTSFLALARTLPCARVNPQEVYEYVFNGVSLGNMTPIAGIQRLGFGECIVLDPLPVIEPTECFRQPPLRTDGADAGAHGILQKMLDHTAMLGHVFEGRIKLPLTGGYDSRLLLALFRRNGISPELFVYGIVSHCVV